MVHDEGMKKTEEKIFVFCESFSSQSISEKEDEKKFVFVFITISFFQKKITTQKKLKKKKETERKEKSFVKGEKKRKQ